VNRRLICAFVAAPLVPALLALPIALLVPPSSSLSGFALFVTVWSPVIAIPATLLIGVPMFLWFRRRGWLKQRHVLLGGALVGAIVTLLFAILSLTASPNWYYANAGRFYVHSSSFLEGLAYAALFVPFGVAMAWIFWAIAFGAWMPNNSLERTVNDHGFVKQRRAAAQLGR